MATAHGSTAKLYANGFDLSSFMKSGTSSFKADTAEVTTWGSTGKLYIPGKTDATLSGEGVYDADMVGGGKADDVLSAILGVAAPMVHLPQGDVLGSPCNIMDAIQTTYEVTSPDDDATTFTMEAQSSAGLARGVSLRPKAGALTISATGNGSSVDDQAGYTTPVATAFGGIGILQVLDKGGGAGTIVVSIDSSTTGSSGWVAVGTFASQSAKNTSQVIYVPVGTTINRYIRASWVVTGTPTWDIFVGFARRQS